MAKQNNYFRLEMLVLRILESEDRYGYQIVQDIYAQSDHMIAVQEGTLYPVLYKLQSEGCISSYKVQAGQRRMRVYYHLEDKGRIHMAKLFDEFRSRTKAIMDLMTKKP